MKFKQIGYDKVTSEDVHNFLNGSNSMERVIKIETDYRSDHVWVIYRDENGVKKRKKCNFYPFVWATVQCSRRLFDGDRERLKKVMLEDGIGAKGLRVDRQDHTIPERMKNGYRVMFFAKKPMSYNDFLGFFKKGGMPIYPDEKDRNYGEKEYIAVSPVEQYMIETGTRMFKGYENYDELVRLEWDIETEGLDAEIHRISQIGIRTNKGYEKIITVGPTDADEVDAIMEFFSIVKKLSPDVITGHNSENFDWNFIETRLMMHGYEMRDISTAYFPHGVYKKDKMEVLKLGGEMEYYRPTVMWGFNITDSLFAVRRAQALDSNMKQATLKYVTKYAGLVKPNRVYVPGKIINDTWVDEEENYAFNNENGNWFKISDKLDKITVNGDDITDIRTGEKFKRTTGRYIVQRYLLDDLYETDKVELQYNQSNFLVGKMLPVSFEKVCTMGTAAIWKYIMLAWSFEQGLAVPELTQSRSFTGGLSRLLKVGWVDNIVKLDYNSLYPSILLTFNIKTPIDIMDTMSAMLEYILTSREHFKGLKALHGKKANELKARLEKELDTLTKILISELKQQIAIEKQKKNQNDTLQLPFKVFGNGFFGSYGSGSIFPWSDIECAEETTCTGRQCLRLMISHFTNLGYKPIVGDSFTEDTPLFIKYDNSGLIDIKPIKELIDEENINIDTLGREYDYTNKPYKVLSRSGWVKPEYIYRHKTDKSVYRVIEENKGMAVDITEDHSLFNSEQEKIKPSEINSKTKLEYYSNNDIFTQFNTLTRKDLNEDMDSWLWLLNATVDIKQQFITSVDKSKYGNDKVAWAKIEFIANCVIKNGKV